MISVTSTELRLHEASRNNDVETVRALVASNTDVNSKNNVRIIVTSQALVLVSFTFNVLQLDRTALHWGAANGHVQVVEILIKTGADVDAEDKVLVSHLQDVERDTLKF